MATITVTRLDDTTNTAGITLREALDQANSSAGADEIVFADGLSGVINLNFGELRITDAVRIDGDGRITVSGDRLGDDVTVDGVTDIDQSGSQDRLGDNSRVIYHGATAGVELSGLTITGGSAVAAPLPHLHRSSGQVQFEAGAIATPATPAGALILSGSCSAATRRQVARFSDRAPAHKIDPVCTH